MELSKTIVGQLSVDDDDISVSVMANPNGIKRLLCIMGFHSRDNYEMVSTRNAFYSMTFCDRCGRLLFVFKNPKYGDSDEG